MLAPVVVAQTAGIGVGDAAIDALMVLSVNGDMIGAGPALAGAIAAAGGDFLDAGATGRALAAAAAGRPLRFGVPFPLSMHAALVDYWLAASGARRRRRASSPCRRRGWRRRWPRGEIDAFCVGEPWGSVAVEIGAAAADPARRRDLAVRAREGARHAARDRRGRARARRGADARGLAGGALARRPGERDDRRRARRAAPPISTSRPRSSSGRSPGGSSSTAQGREARVPRAIEFFAGAASFPWRSQALWIAEALARTHRRRPGAGCAPRRGRASGPTSTARCSDRSAPTCPAPRRSSRARWRTQTAVASTLGRLLLGPDRFFDGRVFDPTEGD